MASMDQRTTTSTGESGSLLERRSSCHSRYSDYSSCSGQSTRPHGTGALANSIYQEFSSRFTGAESSRRWLVDIVPAIHRSRTYQLLLAARGAQQKNSDLAIAIVWHPETAEATDGYGHLHVYHICLYHQSRCTCRWLRDYSVKRRDARRIVRPDTLDSHYFYNWLEYFLSGSREILHFQIGPISFWRKIHQIANFRRAERTDAYAAARLLEEGQFQSECTDWSCVKRPPADEANPVSPKRTKRSTPEGHSTLSGSEGRPTRQLINLQATHDFIYKKFNQFLTVPIEAVAQTDRWINDPSLRCIDASNPDYRRACSSFNRSTQFHDFDQLFDLHQMHSNHAYYLARTAPHDFYYTPEQSRIILEHFLLEQFNQDSTQVESFLSTLHRVCERRAGKLNSIYLHGPPNAGKSWFANCLTAFYLNVGSVANYVRGQNFPFNDCINRRILIWNEPSIMPSAYDDVKMLTGGDPLPCHIKYQGDGLITKTPLIFTANTKLFNFADTVWSSRIAYYHWKPSQFLKNLEHHLPDIGIVDEQKFKQPHPLGYGLLIKKWLQ